VIGQFQIGKANIGGIPFQGGILIGNTTKQH